MIAREKGGDGAGLGRLCRFRAQSVQDILDALSEGVLVVDDRLQIIAVNRAVELLLGRGADDLVGRNVCEIFGEDSCPRECLDQTLRTGETISDYQTEVRLADVRRGQVLIRTVALRDVKSDDEAVSGAAMILSDVSEVVSLRKEVARRRFGGMVGENVRMKRLFGLIEDVAPSDASVLIRGETGTGKELVARALHFAGSRPDGPFVMVNCSALSETLLESELFGHVRGAYTGAVADRAGRFEGASGGTIFLDEIGDISPVVQVKLLRVLQEKVVERVGDNRPIPVDVRIVSATNRDLEALMAAGRMREDFYYRIKVVALDVPPLRERREDIALLVEHFLERRGASPIDPEAMRLLMAYSWPGNVRELENAIEHALVLARGGVVGRRHLPVEVLEADSRERPARRPRPHSDQEREMIAAALDAAGWNRSRAARRLGIDRSTLWRKIREYGLKPEDD